MEETFLPAVDPAPPAYPTLKESWAVLGWFILVSLLVVVPVVLLLKVAPPLTEQLKKLVYGVTGEVVILLTILWLRQRAGAARWPGIEWRAPLEKWQWYALLPLLVLAQASLLTVLSFLRLPHWTGKNVQELADYPMLMVGLGCVAAPILEECLFRGILLKGLLRNYRPAVAITQSALLFGLFHFSPAQSISAICMGLLLGWLYYQTRSLLLGICLHGLYNLLAFSSMRVPQLVRNPDLLHFISAGWYAVLLLVAAVLLAGWLWWLHGTLRPVTTTAADG